MAEIQQSDLKVNLLLNNTGSNAIPVYAVSPVTGNVYTNDDGSLQKLIDVQPGSEIGTITSFNSQDGKVFVYLKGNDISNAYSMWSNLLDYATLQQHVGGVLLSDLQANITPDELQAMISQQNLNDAQNPSFSKSVKAFAETAGEDISAFGTGLIPWNLVFIAGAGYVLLNWNKFFKAR